jgi:hypothetical protein
MTHALIGVLWHSPWHVTKFSGVNQLAQIGVPKL